jgi:hypothetical protein
LAALFSLDQGQDWLITTPEGYYDGSLNGAQMVRWRVGDSLFPVEQYEGRFKRPDLVARALRGEEAPADLPVISAKRTPPLVTLEIEGGTVEVEGDSVKVRIVITPGAPEAAIKKVELRVNGRLIDLQRAKSLTIASKSLTSASKGFVVVGQESTVQRLEGDASDNRLFVDATVALLPGEQEAKIIASVYDDQELRGDSQLVVLKRKATPTEVLSDLYVLAVGVSRYATNEYNLHFADADATELADVLEKQEGKAFRRVQVKVVMNEEATNEGVRNGLKWLQEAPQDNDIAVALFSGHGVRGHLRKLYFFTHNGDLDALRDTCVGWDEVDQALRQCRARQVVMFMDCCHAGQFGERRASADELADQLVKKAGVMVFASSRGNEESLEYEQWGHGAFTKAILDGLRGAADPYKRGVVTVTALVDYVSGAVAQMTNNLQHPWLPRAEQFDTQLKLAKVR